jgi:hypothetical protein
MPRAGTRARRRHLIMDIHHVMLPVRRRTASPLLRNRIQTNGSHLRSLSPRDFITRGRYCLPPDPYDIRCLTIHLLRQPSYTSAVPQIGNGTNRGDYPHYAIQATPGAQRDRAAASQAPPLFDSRHGTMPHTTMLVHLVQVFFECFSRNFPFLQYDDVSRRMFNGTLSPLLANSIASLAARYSQSSDVLVRGATAVSNAYADVAKVCVLPGLLELSFPLTNSTHSASSRTVPKFPTLRFFTPSSSLPGLNIKPGAWPARPSTVRCVCDVDQ